MNRQELEEKITSYLLGDLPPEEAEEIRALLEESPGSRALARELEQTLDLVRGALAADFPVPEKLSTDRKAKIREAAKPAPLIWFTRNYKMLAQAAAVVVLIGSLVVVSQVFTVREARIAASASGPAVANQDVASTARYDRDGSKRSGMDAYDDLDSYDDEPAALRESDIQDIEEILSREPFGEPPQRAVRGMSEGVSGRYRNGPWPPHVADQDVESSESEKDDSENFGLARSGEAGNAGSTTPEVRGLDAESYQIEKLLADDLAEAKADMMVRKARLKKFESMDDDELLHRQLAKQGLHVKLVRKELGEDHPDVQRLEEGGETLIDDVRKQVEGLEKGLQADYEVAKAGEIAPDGNRNVLSQNSVFYRKVTDADGKIRFFLDINEDGEGWAESSAVAEPGERYFNDGTDLERTDTTRNREGEFKEIGQPIHFERKVASSVTQAGELPSMAGEKGDKKTKNVLAQYAVANEKVVRGNEMHFSDDVNGTGRTGIEIGRPSGNLRPDPTKKANIADIERDGRLSMYNTEVRSRWNPPLKTDLELPAGKSGTLEQKLESVIIPSLDLENADITDVLAQLGKVIRASDPEGEGVNLVLKSDPEENKKTEKSGTEAEGPRITLTLRRISAKDALQIITEYADLKYEIRDNVVFVTPPAIPKAPVVAAEPAKPPVFKPAAFNPYIETAIKPLSTFSIDVDTAAYTLARKYMNSGSLPPPEAVRTEEFVNFFDYDYSAPQRQTFEVYTTVARTPFTDGELLKIGVKGRRLGREEERPAVLTFVIDSSGSMDTPDRLGLVKASLKKLVSSLAPRDRVAIVQVDSRARLVLPHVVSTDTNRIFGILDSIQCSGSTHLEEGITLGYQVARKGFQAGSENRVLILSDGVANLGADSADQILNRVEESRRQGITCSVFGFGIGTYDDVMLEELADKGDGVYRFIDSEEEAHRVFVDELAAAMQFIAKDVKIQVEFDPERVQQYRQVGYENRALKDEDFRNDTVDAGEVGSGQSVTALYEILPGDRTDKPIGVVRVRYRNYGTGEVEEIAHAIKPSDVVGSFEETDSRFRLAAATAEFAEILRGSPYASDSTFSDVADVLRPVSMELSLDQHVQELGQLVQLASGLPRAAVSP